MTNRDFVLMVLFAAIIAALGLVPPIQFIAGVPISLQTLGVMLAGLCLGPMRAGGAIVVILILVAIGVPVLSGGRGGLAVYAGPTAGYLVGWLPGAMVTGWLADRFIGPSRSASTKKAVIGGVAAAIIGGIGVVYALGIPWLAFVANAPIVKMAYGNLAFIPGDVVKAVLAALIANSVARVYPLPRG
ncbi:Biotin ECF transporter S component BioY [Hartmannibacter diazotrophicus]|uniref:Biotin transporter n=1 Tax=Hartmannibacter diazotrophicus TaxID=1482074 RepID=A0A2C9D4V8_9HYPH|nr:biotin transporter BioY [Hartmannibacter diazotrophicus]SON54535.1 Biotin ECF transporter S component BioY [Hartmannibacter diazotrophicus]